MAFEWKARWLTLQSFVCGKVPYRVGNLRSHTRDDIRVESDWNIATNGICIQADEYPTIHAVSLHGQEIAWLHNPFQRQRFQISFPSSQDIWTEAASGRIVMPNPNFAPFVVDDQQRPMANCQVPARPISVSDRMCTLIVYGHHDCTVIDGGEPINSLCLSPAADDGIVAILQLLVPRRVQHAYSPLI